MKNAEAEVNFGAILFKHDPPDGFLGLVTAPSTAVVTGLGNGRGSGDVELLMDPVAVILEPARELATQVCDSATIAAQLFYYSLNFYQCLVKRC
eukprot:SAG31_NODE_3531_length_4151_cov_2.125864_6_plen_94_part_00